MAHHGIADLIRDLGKAAIAVELWQHEILEEAGRIVQKEAKRVIGTYEYGWPQLAERTQKERSEQGFPPNEPLLRTGEMRDSIEYTVHGKSCYVGSNNDKAVIQEMGTSRIPARSFLAGAAMAKEKHLLEEVSTGLYIAVASALGIESRHLKTRIE